MKNLGFYNGEIAEIENIKVPMNDRACCFGDGVYEAALAANGVIFTLDEHLDRLERSAAALEIPLPRPRAALAELLESLVKKVESPVQFVYWQLSRGTADRNHAFPENAETNLWVSVRPFKMPDLTKRIKLITLEDTRFLHCDIKTLNLLPNVMASEKAKRAGAYEAVFHRGNRVTECSHSNAHIIKDGTLFTAPADNLILAGITRAHILRACKKIGVNTSERGFTVSEMKAADEIITSSSSSFCFAADTIDGVPAGGKAPDLVRQLQELLGAEFREATGSV